MSALEAGNGAEVRGEGAAGSREERRCAPRVEIGWISHGID